MSDLVLERRDDVLVARLNRPEARNTLHPELMRRISAAVVDAEDDREIRALVITGTGDRVFCAGMDLRAFTDRESSSTSDRDEIDGFLRLNEGRVAVPVIGAANGSAVGGGFELLLGCDLVVASSAAKFGFPEVKRGLLPAGVGAYLAMRIPLAIAMEMIVLGDNIDAARAHALGLVNAVVDPDDVLETALDLARRVAANGPLGVAAAKELVRLGRVDARRTAERLVEWREIVFTSEDAREGVLAFLEKRVPVWKGR